MQKLDMKTPDITKQNIEKITALFPNCLTEAKDENGNIVKGINFDLLRQELSDSIVEGPKERYQMTWPGKREALVHANTPIDKTLRPCREESVDFDTTHNLYIEGDNLEALKLLQESYLGKVKMIYIDPPYNTGKDFVYKDNFKRSEEEELEASGQRDERGGKLVANPDGNGRFHTNWLNMMYARLKIVRNLLSDDGVLFVSIDDNELSNLRKICDEIFGEENFLVNVAWKHTQQSKNDELYFSRQYNALVGYRKSSALKKFRFPRTAEDNRNYSNPDNDPNGDWRSGDVRSPNYRSTLCYDIHTPSGKTIQSPENGWRWSESEVKKKIDSGEIIFNDEETKIVRKIYLKNQEGRTPENVWIGDEFGTSRNANAELKDLFEGNAPFDTPKPTNLIKKIGQLFKDEKEYICMDFFSGSATTAHAVFKLNVEDGGNRQFIMVQIPEETDEKSEAYKAGYKTIAEIGKERIRRAGKKVKKDNAEKEDIENLDIGFRVLKIDTSNMKDVYYTPDAIDQSQLEGLVDNIKEDRTSEDLLFQVLLDWGVDLTLPISKETIMGKEVYFVDEDTLAACFDEGIDEPFVKELASREVMRVVFKDSGFASDAMKNNVDQIFAQLSPDTEVRAI